MKQLKSKYLKIKKFIDDDFYTCINIQQQVIIGYIKKRRLGRFIHWCLEPKPDTYFSNGCLKEISKFITQLYNGS